MALTKVSTGVVDMSQDTGGLIIAKGNGTDVSSGGARPTSIRNYPWYRSVRALTRFQAKLKFVPITAAVQIGSF